MNKKFLAAMMIMVLGSMTFTGCMASNNNNVAVEEEVVEDAVIEEAVEEEVAVEDNVGGSEETPVEEEVVGEVDPSPAQEMYFVITDGIELPVSMNIDAQILADTYGIDESALASYVVTLPAMNVHANEIGVFELKDESSRDAVKLGIEKRVEALEAQWKSYLPDQYELVKNYKVVEKGNFILFVISTQADTIIANFEAAVQ